jgi:pimeloyl-ACP methyl ester carboxylesterase
VGRWEGTTTLIGREFRVAFNFSETRATYDVEEMGVIYEKVRKAVINNDGKFTIYIDGDPSVVLKGVIKDDMMTGTSDDKLKMKFSLKKISGDPGFLNEEEVSYKSGTNNLYGTLIKPNGLGPHPAIVLISGSAAEGKMTRERTRQMGWLFAKNGIAALIYDRRGNGRSEGEKEKIIRMEWLAKDAAAGADFLATRKDIAKNKIGFYGLSQGGWVAPLASSYFKNTAFIIVVSAPGISPDEQNKFASQNMVSGIVNRTIQGAGGPKTEWQGSEYNETGKERSLENKKEIIPGFSSFDPLPYWEKFTAPVLAIYGADDKIVPPVKSRELIAAALKKAGNEQYVFRSFAEADHEIKIKLNEDPPVAIVAVGFNALISDWIKKNVMP